MSENSECYVVSMFTDQSEKRVPDGFRLVKVSWKATTDAVTKKVKEARSAVCCAIPRIELKLDSAGVLAIALQSAFEEMQDKVVSQVVNKQLAENTGMLMSDLRVEKDLLTLEGIATWHAAEAISKRLSKDGIKNWFDVMLRDELGIAFSQIPGITDAKVMQAVSQHCEIICKLASPKAFMSEDTAKGLQKAINLVKGNDAVKVSLLEKVEAFLKPRELMLEISLGISD